MLRVCKNSLVAALLLLVSAWGAKAQDGTFAGYSPYSSFGVGQFHSVGTSWNKGMGGIGIAARNNRFINVLNPASVTARDTLSFMSDFGLKGRISVFHEGDKKGLNTTFNIDDFVISFPMWNHTAFMLGLTPMTDVGYNIAYQTIDLTTGKESFSSTGKGGLYQLFGAAAVTLWNRLSLGVQVNYCFGNIDKYSAWQASKTAYQAFDYGDSLQVNNVNVKFGLQYEQPLSTTSKLTLGATYRLSTPIFGHAIYYQTLGSYHRERNSEDLSGLRMGDELGVGLSYRKADIWSIEVDYTRSNWANSGFENVRGFSTKGDILFASSVGQSVRIGGEWTPNRNDIRYFMRRCTYRAGAYWDRSYYTVAGSHVDAIGITIGMTVPVFRWYNGISVSLEAGRRGLQASQIKENYFGFSVGMNVFDIWFQKPKYE